MTARQSQRWFRSSLKNQNSLICQPFCNWDGGISTLQVSMILTFQRCFTHITRIALWVELFFLITYFQTLNHFKTSPTFLKDKRRFVITYLEFFLCSCVLCVDYTVHLKMNICLYWFQKENILQNNVKLICTNMTKEKMILRQPTMI